MKHVTLVLSLLFCSALVNAQGLMWAKHFNGAGSNLVSGVIPDNAGNYYLYGSFNGTATQDAMSITSAGLQDAYIAKYDKNGQILWLKQISGTATESAVNIVMGNDGNYFYISGTTNGSVDFDGTIISSSGGLDVFLAKYALDGTLQWVHNTAYGTGNQGGGYFTLDANDNLIQLGVFTTTVTFYGGTTTLNDASGIRQNYITKYDSNGNLLWAEQLQDDNVATSAKSVSACSDGYFISGNYTGNLTLPDLSVISSTALNDVFLYKTDLDGNGLFVRKISGNNDEFTGKHISDTENNQYLTGYFKSTRIKVDSTETDTSLISLNNVSSGSYDLYLAKYNSSGTLQWIRTIGSSGNDYSYHLSELNNNLIITGCYSSLINFDSFQLTNDGGNDAFVAVCNSSGQFSEAYKASGTGSDAGKTSIYNTNGKNFVVGGEFFSTVLTIGSNEFTNSVQDLTTRDAYLARYGCFDSVATSFTSVSCYGLSDGTATATPTLGSEPYTYVWSNDSTTSTITGLTTGTYTVTVTGANNCTAVNSVIVTQPNVLTSDTSQTNVSCYGGNNGTATIIPSGGTPSYNYLWSDNQTTATATNLIAGIYSVTVTDGCSNTTINNITVTEPSIILATPSQVEPSINSCDGTATITPSGGTSPFTYLWSNSQTTSTANSFCGGICSVTVSDNNGCTTTQEYTFKKAINLSVFGTPTANSATLIWDGNGATSYQIQYFIEGTTNYNNQNVVSSPFTLNALEPNTAYCCRIRTNIDGNYTNYSSIVHFTTSNGSSILATNLTVFGTPTATTAILTWSGSGADSYQIQYYINGSINYLFNSSTSSPTTLINLQPNTTYNCRIRTYSGGTYTNYSSTISFTTSDGSYIATNLSISGTPTANSATLIWNGSGADSYQIQYFINGTTNYLSQNTTASPFTLNSLQPNTAYNCRIRTYSGGTYTTYSSIISFTTADGASILATNLAVQGTPTANTCTLTWNGSGATAYQIQYFKAGTTIYKMLTCTTSPATLKSLEPNTNYNCRIRTYSGGTYTNYSALISFTTAGSKQTENSYSVFSEEDIISCVTYPNPFSTSSTILIQGNSEKSFTTYLYDVTGKFISDKKVFCNIEYVYGEELEKGIYFLVITGDDYKETLKIVKTE